MPKRIHSKYRLKRMGCSRHRNRLAFRRATLQSFSMAGLRQLVTKKLASLGVCQDTNTAEMVLLENVSGILRAFSSDGERYFAWFEVAKAFGSLGYYPLCLHINAKHVTAQNRPRFIILAFRHDVFKRVKANAAHSLAQYLREAESFVKQLKGHQPPYGALAA